MDDHLPTKAAIDSVRNLWFELLAAERSPTSVPPDLLAACSTQEKLSRYRCYEKSILPLSLNTFKAAAQIAVENGGWGRLDDIRRKLFRRSEPHNLARRKNSRRLGSRLAVAQQNINHLEQSNQQLLRGRAVLLHAYSDVLALLRKHQSLSPLLSEQLREHEATFDIRKLSEAETTSVQA
ncbi:hypothetical protein [Caballeronia sp. S22]|uniref:hypothetical protein n=1 Tax=Caballeronia sp. S22 TaxID=3137182 RepID=UPI003530BF39